MPKTHKEGEPLRPIVSGIDDPLDRLGWLLEQITSQLLAFVPAHLNDTGDFLGRLRDIYPTGFPAGSIAFSIDVKNLYGNIPTDEAIEAVMELICENRNELNLFGLGTEDVRALLSHSLHNDHSRFNETFYKQTNGIAMGSRIAPSIAIVFMGKLEAEAVEIWSVVYWHRCTDTHTPAPDTARWVTAAQRHSPGHVRSPQGRTQVPGREGSNV